MNHRLLLTGATGFVGKFLCQDLLRKKYHIRALVRKKSDFLERLGVEQVLLSEDLTVLAQSMVGFDYLIHLAGRAHKVNEQAGDPLAEYQKVNVAFTDRLLQAMITAKVKHLLFISSIHVFSSRAVPFPIHEQLPCEPNNDYGVSKLEAEQLISTVCAKNDIAFVVLRPPLIYGPEVPANMRNLMKLVKKAPALPFGNAHNVRSMIYVGNLASIIEHCIKENKFSNQSYYVSDQQDVSLKFLVSQIAQNLEKKVWLFPVPVRTLKWLAKFVPKLRMVDQLWGDLQVDSSLITKELGWRPVYTPEQGIVEMVKGFK